MPLDLVLCFIDILRCNLTSSWALLTNLSWDATWPRLEHYWHHEMLLTYLAWDATWSCLEHYWLNYHEMPLDLALSIIDITIMRFHLTSSWASLSDLSWDATWSCLEHYWLTYLSWDSTWPRLGHYRLTYHEMPLDLVLCIIDIMRCYWHPEM